MTLIGDEILVLRTMFLKDVFFLPPTRSQILGLRSLVSQAVSEDRRHAVMQLITGLQLKEPGTGRITTHMLTRHMASVLIDQFVEQDERGELVHPWKLREHYARFLEGCQAVVEAQPAEPWRVDPRGL